MATEDSTRRLAVLIDADNARAARISAILAEVATYGTAHVKRAYGDWTGTNLRGWKQLLLTLSIQPVQQFAYTTGKNATDAAMVIDAMDLLYSGRFDGFCIVSSDSDFTRLAARIREQGLIVYGFGERKTPTPFVAACDKFVYVENLDDPVDPATPETVEPAPVVKAPPKTPLSSDSRLIRQLRAAAEAASDDDGWASLGQVGNLLTTTTPDFDPRSWGHRKLSDLIAATGLFEIERRRHGSTGGGTLYVRDQRAAQRGS